MVDLHLLKYTYLGSSLADFHISTRSWLLLREVPHFSNQDFKAWSSHSEGRPNAAFIVQYSKVTSELVMN